MRRDRTRSRRGLSPFQVMLLVLIAAGTAWAVVNAPGLYARALHPLFQQDIIAQAARTENVDPYLVAAMVNVESGFRATVRSSAGAVGLMQVKPSTAKAVARRLGITGTIDETALRDPVVNIRVGTAYYAELLARYHGIDKLALAAYNGGISNADRWAAGWGDGSGGLATRIDFPATVKYVGEVLAQRDVYRSLYPGVFAVATK